LRIYAKLVASGLEPKRLHFEIAINAYLSLDDVKSASELLSKMIALKIEIDDIICRLFMEKLIATGHLDKALQLFNLLKSKLFIKLETKHLLITACGKAGRFADSLHIYNGLKGQNIREETRLIMINVCKMNGENSLEQKLWLEREMGIELKMSHHHKKI